MAHSHLAASRLLPFVLMLLWMFSCGKLPSDSKPQQLQPRLPLESVHGTYTGIMSTARGVEAVVLYIQDVTPQEEGYAFRYTLNVQEQMEEGLGTIRPDVTSTRICFDDFEEVCGWLLSEGGDVRIVADSDDLDAPLWSLEKL